MEKLKEIELYGKGLVEIRTQQIVARYNAALQNIGLEPTALKKFSIDGWGWSPEIAIEKENNFYLSHGLANPYGIIISPEQENVPLFMPHHSFDNKMREIVFLKFRRQISDLTLQTAIIIECDQEISSYRTPMDLLSIEYFTLKFSTTDNLSEAKKAQMALERSFYENENAWADKEFRNLLRISYRKHGVMADKKYLLPEYKFLEIDSFYTRAFNGVFIIRDEKKIGQTLMIREHGMEVHGKIRGQASNHVEYFLHDARLMTFLKRKDIIDVYPYYLFGQVEDLERIHFLLLAEVLLVNEPDVDLNALTSGQIKKWTNTYSGEGGLPDHYFELETIINKVKKGQLIDKDKLSKPLCDLLKRPNPEFDKNQRWLFWKVLLKLNSSDIFRLYVYDKQEFFTQYKNWPEMKKAWAVRYIKHRYIHTKELNTQVL